MLVEYKPFEPAFYHTDIADWGMALLLARAAGPQAKVLVDTGHHYLSQNIEQIVAWLLAEDMLGGFHFNDRRYADDDLTLGLDRSLPGLPHLPRDPASSSGRPARRADIAYMIDQSHNLKGKIEAMIQTVTIAQELVRQGRARRSRRAGVGAAALRPGGCGSAACRTRSPPTCGPRSASGATPKACRADPMEAFRESGYLERITAERGASRPTSASSYA